MTLLRPHRRVDILRDAMAARDARRPYVVTFCGVNGVGKSTNLAKVNNSLFSSLYYKHQALAAGVIRVRVCVTHCCLRTDFVLAHRERIARADRSVRHVPRRRSRAAAHAQAQAQRTASGQRARRPQHGGALRERLRQGRCRHRHGGRQLRYDVIAAAAAAHSLPAMCTSFLWHFCRI